MRHVLLLMLCFIGGCSISAMGVDSQSHGVPSHNVTTRYAKGFIVTEFLDRPKLSGAMSSDKHYRCTTCQKTFDSNEALRMHNNMQHTFRLWYTCKYCSVGSWDQQWMQSHVLSHERCNQEKQYCPECKKWVLYMTAHRNSRMHALHSKNRIEKEIMIPEVTPGICTRASSCSTSKHRSKKRTQPNEKGVCADAADASSHEHSAQVEAPVRSSSGKRHCTVDASRSSSGYENEVDENDIGPLFGDKRGPVPQVLASIKSYCRHIKQLDS